LPFVAALALLGAGAAAQAAAPPVAARVSRHFVVSRSRARLRREDADVDRLVSTYTDVLPDNPLREANTATGGTFHSDGRVLVLKLVDTSGGRMLV
jgi:hypothetical protein